MLPHHCYQRRMGRPSDQLWSLLLSSHPNLSLCASGNRIPVVHPEAKLFNTCHALLMWLTWLFSRGLKTQLVIISAVEAPGVASWLGWVHHPAFPVPGV